MLTREEIIIERGREIGRAKFMECANEILLKNPNISLKEALPMIIKQLCAEGFLPDYVDTTENLGV